ncbi:MAG TPA: hypothetical protein DCX54_04760, partial [Flavobacteriales bacterium]|nr:hypothetical protein [Flavobacteriales bacterium]
DGMAVTAEVWEAAHGEHRLAIKAHTLVAHGTGIFTGLEVKANDPTDQFVYISPGIAVDTVGNIIVVPEPVMYDFGSAANGFLYLLLVQGEREVGGVGNEAKFIQTEYVIAARPTLPKRPYVELARLTLSKKGNSIKDSKSLHPISDELDLRYRHQLATGRRQLLRVMVYGAGGEDEKMLAGWDHLEKFCKLSTSITLVIDQVNSLPDHLGDYDLIYIGGLGTFSLSDDVLNALKSYISQDKILFLETLNDTAKESCQGLLDNLKEKVKPIEKHDEILASPFLFMAPPPGASSNQIKRNKHVIYSTAGYALAWAGITGAGTSSRSEIRSVHEWGVNLMTECLSRTKQ